MRVLWAILPQTICVQQSQQVEILRSPMLIISTIFLSRVNLHGAMTVPIRSYIATGLWPRPRRQPEALIIPGVRLISPLEQMEIPFRRNFLMPMCRKFWSMLARSLIPKSSKRRYTWQTSMDFITPMRPGRSFTVAMSKPKLRPISGIKCRRMLMWPF
jgi:hypothetical protein